MVRLLGKEGQNRRYLGSQINWEIACWKNKFKKNCVFGSQVNESGAAAKDKRLHVGQRILEV